MLSQVSKKNTDIMSILENAGVMPTIEIVCPYLPKVVRVFIYNMREDDDDPESPNLQKVTLRNHTVDFSPSIINAYYGKKMGEKLVDTSGALDNGNQRTAKIIRDEIMHLEGVIQSSLAIKYVLEARLRSVLGEVDP
ncbi:hypothetical protein LIER_18743 [Lithospermum erythrorhizon]|uniref:Peptide deformylase n=1 Tax=Lithospermum erythrorhizon TaxID=34254 RepID=A0AAV3QI99_LITER